MLFARRVKLERAPIFRQLPLMGKGMQKSSFGASRDGREIHLYTMTNAHGLRCSVATYGATLTELRAPDREGRWANLILAYPRLEDYENGKAYLGAIIGRVANRIGQARFVLDGKTYALAANDGRNHLHGGLRGFDKRVWEAEPSENALRLRYTSADGEEGYPGTLQVTATYTLTDANELVLDCEAETDQPTPVNLTSHPYWNLAGEGDILGHELTVASDCYTPCDGEFVPTGKLKSVAGTPFDFRRAAAIGSQIGAGHNTNYVLRRDPGRTVWVACVKERSKGRVMEVLTDQPGLQFYTGTFLKGVHQPYAGFCLETQGFPDAVNHANFPSVILRPGEIYRHKSVCRFSAA
jgi:aldose 1-epimerase